MEEKNLTIRDFGKFESRYVSRRKNFLENIKNIQVIITCTDKIVLENLNYFLYNVVDGKIIEKEK